MVKIVLFGGTTEGRALAELLRAKDVPALVCVATEYGEKQLSAGGSVRVHAGRLDAAAITAMLLKEQPETVLDATHPYAVEVSRNIAAACQTENVRYLRVCREGSPQADCLQFDRMDALIDWLNTTTGTVFSALGVKEAAALAGVTDYRERVWLRILPMQESLRLAEEAGFPAKHIICMQGPFSVELNEAMFRASGARIVVTKESGGAGGFLEKLAAANACQMTMAVLTRPVCVNGMALSEILTRIKEDRL